MEKNTFVVQATSPSESLVFSSEPTSGDPSYGNEITDVSLVMTGVPEASTSAMLVAGFGCLGLIAFRRQKGSISAVA